MLETPKLYKNTLSWPKTCTYCSAFKSFLCAKHFFNGKWMMLETPKLDENTLSWLKTFTYCSAFKSFLYSFFFFQMKAIFIQGAFKNIQGLLGKFKDFSRIVRTMRFMEEVNKRRRNFLPNIRHFQRIGINVTKSKKPLVHFKSDIFDAVALVDAKTQIWIYATAWLKEGRLKCLCVTNVTGLLCACFVVIFT